MENYEIGRLSEDGNWSWDGTEWIPVVQQTPSGVPQEVLKKLEEKKGESLSDATNSHSVSSSPSSVVESVSHVRETSQDKMLTALAIGVLLFSSVTGILAQSFSNIEQEAAEHESESMSLAAEARGLEAIENQALLREEILLTEVKSLLLTNELSTEAVQQQTSELAAIEQNFYAQLDAYELLYFMYDAGPVELFDIYCYDASTVCSVDVVDAQHHDLYIFTYTFDVNGLQELEARLTSLSEVDADFLCNQPFECESIFDIQMDSDAQNETYSISLPQQFDPELMDFFGIYWHEYELELLIDEAKAWISEIEFMISTEESNRTVNLANWNLYNSHANTNELIGELYWSDGLVDDANAYFGMSFENQTLADETVELINENFANISLYNQELSMEKTILSELEGFLNEVSKAGLANKISEQEGKFEEMESSYIAKSNEVESLNSSIEMTASLVSRLLSQSLAFNASVIDGQSGEYISTTAQASFYESMHFESNQSYSEAQTEQEKADTIRAELAELSTAVMLVSVGNVILGVAGGMVTKAKQGNGNKRNILILLCSGALVGTLGAIQSLAVVF